MFRSKSKFLLFFVFLTAATFVSSAFSSVYAATPSDPNGGYRVTESGSGYADYVFSYAGTKADGADIDITAIIGVNLKTGTKAIFKYDSASKEYIRNATGEGADLDGCSDRIQGNNPNRTIQSGADLTNATLYSFERYSISIGPIQRTGSCGAQPSAETGFRKITLTADQKEALGQIESATQQQPSDVPGQDKPTCGEGLQTGTGWIVCPIAEGADSFVVWVDSVLYDLLRVNELQADSGIQDGWRAFRNIASALIVVVALVMIASQIFSFEFMSAYTIKKILPRIFIAAIAIQLSWILAELLVGFFNALGDGVEAILYAPFPDIIKAVSDGGSAIVAILNEFNSTLDEASRGATGGWGDGILIGAALAGYFAAGGFWGILGMALLLVALAMIAFVTLVLRKVVILALVIVFPVAIVAWVLPNTQKWWSNWWGMFSKLLLMYPLVIGLLTIGKIFAWIAATGAVSTGPGAFLYAVTAQGGSQLAVLFIILVAYFGPYAFIPAMFKLSGGIFAKAAGLLEGSGKKAFSGIPQVKRVNEARDNYKKGRDYNRKQQGLQRAASGKTALSRRYGQFQAGTLGAKGQYARQLRASEEQESIKNAQFELATITKGQGYTPKIADLATLASAQDGQSVMVNGKRVIASEAMRRTAFKTIVDAAEVDSINSVKDRLMAQGDAGKGLWNTMADENVGALLAKDPTQYGKMIGDLSPEQIVSAKPQSLRRGRYALQSATLRQQQAAVNRAHATLNNEEALSKLSEAHKAELEKIALGDFTSTSTKTVVHEDKLGNVVASYDAIVDFAGRTDFTYDNAGNLVANPDFGRSASARRADPNTPGDIGAPGSPTNPAPRLY